MNVQTLIWVYIIIKKFKIIKKCKTYAQTRDWTRDLKIFSLTLSQLSYLGSLYFLRPKFPLKRTRNKEIYSAKGLRELIHLKENLFVVWFIMSYHINNILIKYQSNIPFCKFRLISTSSIGVSIANLNSCLIEP